MDSGHAASISESDDREYPRRPIASAHALVLQGDRVLLIKRAHPPSRGRWSVPGGVIELGETVRDAARRELREECGIEIEIDRVMDVADHVVPDESGRVWFHYVVIYLLARYVGGEARPGSDALAVRWATVEELDALDMHPLARQAVQRAFKMA
jgi:ADP-ribose pyrophosphatase YjhB (NUDIX family)